MPARSKKQQMAAGAALAAYYASDGCWAQFLDENSFGRGIGFGERYVFTGLKFAFVAQ
jgi:hypothetical protein